MVYFFFVTPVLEQLILIPKASNAVILHDTHKVSVGIDVLTHWIMALVSGCRSQLVT